MKLLPKSVVNTELASQKKKQIDEGLMIAKKVDALRLTLASLEKQHQEFISGMKDELKAQTKPLLDEIAERKQDVVKLKLRREEFLVPLTKEWNEVNEVRKSLEVTSEKLAKEQTLLKKAQEILDVRLKKEKESLFKINTIRNEITRVLRKTEENELKTDIALKLAENTREKVLKELEEKKQLILSRDAKVAVREREVELQREKNDLDAKFIKDEKIRLLDQRATLERELARIKNKLK